MLFQEEKALAAASRWSECADTSNGPTGNHSPQTPPVYSPYRNASLTWGAGGDVSGMTPSHPQVHSYLDFSLKNLSE